MSLLNQTQRPSLRMKSNRNDSFKTLAVQSAASIYREPFSEKLERKIPKLSKHKILTKNSFLQIKYSNNFDEETLK